MKAKTTTLFAQIVAAVWVAGWSAYKFISHSDNIQIKDVCISGVWIAACFTPVYFSIILDKVKDIKLGNDTGN